MKNKITNENIYQLRILSVLTEAGGQLPTYRVIKRIGDRLKSSFSGIDLDDHKSGGIRWEANVRRARQHCIEYGWLKNNSPRGVWEITDEGRKQYKAVIEYLKNSKVRTEIS